jgi:hypothetical protein
MAARIVKRGQVVTVRPAGAYTVEVAGITRTELRAARLPTMARATDAATLIPRTHLDDLARLVKLLGGRVNVTHGGVHHDGTNSSIPLDQGGLW